MVSFTVTCHLLWRSWCILLVAEMINIVDELHLFFRCTRFCLIGCVHRYALWTQLVVYQGLFIPTSCSSYFKISQAIFVHLLVINRTNYHFVPNLLSLSVNKYMRWINRRPSSQCFKLHGAVLLILIMDKVINYHCMDMKIPTVCPDPGVIKRCKRQYRAYTLCDL